jgi:hypothetical protein
MKDKKKLNFEMLTNVLFKTKIKNKIFEMLINISFKTLK